jgi:predicted Zn-dependent peptidase
MQAPRADQPKPLLAVISGAVEPGEALALAAASFGTIRPGAAPKQAAWSAAPAVRERIDLPLSQGALGYVVAVPPPATKEGLAARLLLYILTHDYSGRLGRSAITDKGLAYHIYSALRTDGANAWATIWTGVDPGKADALEAELRAQIAGLVANLPTTAEIEAAKRHLLGRNLSSAQANKEIAAKLARGFVESGGLQSHRQLELALAEVSAADVAAAARPFASGTVIRVDVAAPRLAGEGGAKGEP